METIYDNEETLPKIKNDLQDDNDILKNIRDSVYTAEKIDPYTMLGKLNQILKIKKGDKGDTGAQGIRGEQGENGVGIQSITSDEPTQDNGYTITSITFTDTNGNQTTLNVSAKNGENAQVDSELSTTSENPVQNKVIAGALNNVYTKKEVNNLIMPTGYTELTYNSTYVADNAYQKSYWYKIGNIAIVHINNVVFKSVAQSNGAVLYTNLPRHAGTVNGNYVFMLSSKSRQSRVMISPYTRELQNYYDSYTPNENEPFSAVLIYPTID